jgi:6-phosphogluconolactonase
MKGVFTMAINQDIRVRASRAAVAKDAANLFAGSVKEAVEKRDICHVCLSGGAAPRETYSLLGGEAGAHIQWPKVHVYFGDERCVPPDHEDSNYRMADEALLRHVDIARHNIHRMQAELGGEKAAEAYEEMLRTQLRDCEGRFDLVFLGMGEDGHTASLFPETTALDVNNQWCVRNFVPKLNDERVTLTYPILNEALQIVFLIVGKKKAEALRQVLVEPPDKRKLPAQGIDPSKGKLIWLIDNEAASKLPPKILRRQGEAGV